MIEIYCRGTHQSKDSLCLECQQLLQYAMQRVDRCPYGDNKPTCARCPIHCYAPAMRERIRQVMRYSGPRMLLRHPVLTFWHLVDGIAKAANPRSDRCG